MNSVSLLLPKGQRGESNPVAPKWSEDDILPPKGQGGEGDPLLPEGQGQGGVNLLILAGKDQGGWEPLNRLLWNLF